MGAGGSVVWGSVVPHPAIARRRLAAKKRERIRKFLCFKEITSLSCACAHQPFYFNTKEKGRQQIKLFIPQKEMGSMACFAVKRIPNAFGEIMLHNSVIRIVKHTALEKQCV